MGFQVCMIMEILLIFMMSLTVSCINQLWSVLYPAALIHSKDSLGFGINSASCERYYTRYQCKQASSFRSRGLCVLALKGSICSIFSIGILCLTIIHSCHRLLHPTLQGNLIVPHSNLHAPASMLRCGWSIFLIWTSWSFSGPSWSAWKPLSACTHGVHIGSISPFNTTHMGSISCSWKCCQRTVLKVFLCFQVGSAWVF